MAQTRNSKIRVLRRRGKSRLVRVNDQLNTLTWEMFEKNVQLNDVNTARAVAVLDDALSLIQRAGCLLYTSPSPRDGLLPRMPSSA